MEDKEFTFTYSAPTENERREIEQIRKKYDVSTGSGKLMRVRQLDGYVKSVPTAVSLALGVVGTLVFGLGMTFALEWENFPLGVILSAVGIVPIALAYPVYNIISKRLRAKHAEEILTLTAELLGNGE